MRKRRRSWLLAVHRWLFYFAVLVVVGSALSRIDEHTSLRVVDARRPSSTTATHADDDAADDDDDADDRAPPFVAFAGCP